MTVTREDLIPTLIPNTTMQKIFIDGVHKQYSIKPYEGYVLHDNRADEEVTDPDTHELTGDVVLRYSTGEKTVRHDYDFNLIVPDIIQDANGNTVSVNKIGMYKQFTIPKELVPKEQLV